MLCYGLGRGIALGGVFGIPYVICAYQARVASLGITVSDLYKQNIQKDIERETPQMALSSPGI